MTNGLMREPLARQPEPRTHSRFEEGSDEGTSQRYLDLAALKAPQNLPPHNIDLAEILPPHDLKYLETDRGIRIWMFQLRLQIPRQNDPMAWDLAIYTAPSDRQIACRLSISPFVIFPRL